MSGVSRKHFYTGWLSVFLTLVDVTFTLHVIYHHMVGCWMNAELESMRKKWLWATLRYHTIISYLPGRSEENHKKYQSG
jgi:hypothetical protein